MMTLLLSNKISAQNTLNSDLSGDPLLWQCDPLLGFGVEVNNEVVYGGIDVNNIVAEVDNTVSLCQTISGFIVGQVYELNFDCSARTGPCAPPLQIMDVNIDNGAFYVEIQRTFDNFFLQNERHCFVATSTTHTLSFIATFTDVSCGMIVDNINIVSHPFDIGYEEVLCENGNVTLDATLDPTSSYLWQDNSTDPTLTVDQAGEYIVQVTRGYCPVADTIIVVDSPLEVNLGPDVDICSDDIYVLDATAENGTYEWQDGSTNATFSVSQAGTYSVQVIADGCIKTDTVNVTMTSPAVDLGADQTICYDATTILNATTTGASYLWQDNSTAPMYTVNQAGTYAVQILINGCSITDTVVVDVNEPTVDLGNDLSICTGENILLDATTPFATYVWSDNSSDATIDVEQTGDYWVEITVDNCTASDTVNVTVNELSIDLGNDLTFCEGDSVIIDASLAGVTYLWNDNSTNSSLTVNQSGIYAVEVFSTNCTATDSIEVIVNPLPIIDLGPDLIFCADTTITISSSALGEYVWQDGSTNTSFEVDQSGTYWLSVIQNNCTFVDSIEIYIDSFSVDLGNDQSLCDGESYTLTSIIPGATYLWQDGTTNNSLIATQSGTYWVDVTLGSCTFNDEIELTFNPLPNINLGPDLVFCVDTTITLGNPQVNTTYSWQDNSTNPTILVDETNTYFVIATSNGCTNGDTIDIYIDSFDVDLGVDQTMCAGESLILNAGIPDATYLWQNNATSIQINANQTGIYWVEVLAGNCSVTDSIDLIFTPLPIVDLGPDLAICGDTIISLSSPNNNAQYLWEDGSTDSINLVNQTGIYWLEVNANNCIASDTINISINAPVLDLGPDINACIGEDVLIETSNTGTSYLWNTNANSDNILVNESGQYWLLLTVDDCSISDTLEVSFEEPPVDLGNDTLLCEGLSYILNTEVTGATYVWQNNSTESSMTITEEGLYYVTIELNSCSNADSVYVTFAPLPDASISGGGLHCIGEVVELIVDLEGTGPFAFEYKKNGTVVGTVVTPDSSFSLFDSDTGLYEITTVQDFFCVNDIESSTSISDYPPLTLGITYPVAICVDDIITLNPIVSGGQNDNYFYEWNNSNSTISTESILNTSSTEDIYLNLVIQDGCVEPVNDSIIIDIQEPPIPVFEAVEEAYCAGATATFQSINETEDVTCLWTFQNGISIPGCGLTSTSFTNFGYQSITLSMQTSAGCLNSTTLDSLVYIPPNPVALFATYPAAGTTYDPGIQFENNSSDAYLSFWEFGDGQSEQDESPLHYYPGYNSNNYLACLTVENEIGCEDEFCLPVEIIPEYLVNIPNSFTPDGDGLNDLFKPIFNSIVLAEYRIEIYDADGHIIFESDDQNESWNGSNKMGSAYFAKDGVYVYQLITREENNPEKRLHRGHVVLIR